MNSSLQELVERADALYHGRGEIENVRACLKLLEDATTPEAFELAWRRGRAHFFLGQEAERIDQARAHYAKGIVAAEAAARSTPTRVEGHFWSGVNLALLAALEPPFDALRHARRAKRALKRAVEIDPAHHGAGPLRVLARLEHKLPRLFGGGRKRARANFERAIRLAPHNTVTRLYFAEMLIEAGESERASTELEAILNTPPDPAWAFEIERDRKLAREMIRKEPRVMGKG